MTNDTLKLTDQQVLEYARAGLQEHLTLTAEGYKCTTEDLLDVLLGVGVKGGTIEATCADLVGTPDPETIRQYLNEQLTVETLPELEQNLNAALAAQIPRRVYRRACDIAIDFHDRPYYGRSSQEEGLWVRGKAKNGTTRFYRVATAYVILAGLRVTLAVGFFLPGNDTVTILGILLHRVKTLNIQVNRLFLDKGFASIDVMDYLTQNALSALIACPIRGRTGGTRALCTGNKSYLTTHTFKSQNSGSFTADLAVCRVFTTAKRTGRMRRRADWMVFILINLELSPRQARRTYRRRFGIETSYRCAGQVRGWTTSRNPVYRFLLIGLSFFLLNVCLCLRWLFTQVPRRGRRWLDVKRFELTRFANFIVRALERQYGYVDHITAPAAPRL
jgi:putative transposase